MFQQVQYRRTGPHAVFPLFCGHRVLCRAAGQAHTQRLNGRGHGIGGVHATTGTRSGNGGFFNLLELDQIHVPAGMGPHGFEHGNDIGMALTRQNSAAVDKHTGAVESGQTDQTTGHVLVAATNGHQPIKALAAGNRLNGIGNHLARHQRILHALGAVGDAIRNGDGIEYHPFTTGAVSPFTGPLCQLADMAITGCHLAPGGSDAHLWLAKVLVGKTHRP